jgi:hypothetical protein
VNPKQETGPCGQGRIVEGRNIALMLYDQNKTLFYPSQTGNPPENSDNLPEREGLICQLILLGT